MVTSLKFKQFGKALAALAVSMSIGINTAAHAENLLDIYRQAIKSDPTVLAAEASNLAGQEGIDQARSVLLPQISAKWNTNNTRNVNAPGFRTFGALRIPTGSTTDTDTNSWSLSLNQQIYHYDSWIGMSQAKKRAEQSKLAYEVEKQALIVRVAEAYFNILSAKDGLEFAGAEKESIQKQLEQTQQRFDVGLIAITDVHEAKARFDQSTADEILAQNKLDNAFESLRQITGKYAESFSALKEKIPLSTPQPANIADWTMVAERSNINLLSNQLSVDIAREEIKRNSAGHYPTVDLTGTYSDSTSNGSSTGPVTLRDPNTGAPLIDPNTGLPRTQIVTTPFGFGGTSRSINLSFNIPIFSGGRTSSNVRKAQADFTRATQELEKIHRQVIRDTRSAYLGVVASISSVTALQQSQISNEKSLEATNAGFDVGTRTMVDVLLSTSNLFNAKRKLSRSRYDYVLNVLKLKQAAGILTADDLRLINGWLK